ncbi:hypothetical protein L218DRAFT_1002612 [Marasmius fiardii PR-910]|nr:hypothetical protein L218DRAFT_1002612 [Marasmius fiardii PR-910]
MPGTRSSDQKFSLEKARSISKQQSLEKQIQKKEKENNESRKLWKEEAQHYKKKMHSVSRRMERMDEGIRRTEMRHRQEIVAMMAQHKQERELWNQLDDIANRMELTKGQILVAETRAERAELDVIMLRGYEKDFEMCLSHTLRDAAHQRKGIQVLEDKVEASNAMLEQSSAYGANLEGSVSKMKSGYAALLKRNNTLHMQVNCTSERQEKAVKKALEEGLRSANSYYIKEKGVISDNLHAVIQDLICTLGLNQAQILPTVEQLVEEFGQEVKDKVSECSLGRIVEEALLAAKIQVADEYMGAKGSSSFLERTIGSPQSCLKAFQQVVMVHHTKTSNMKAGICHYWKMMALSELDSLASWWQHGHTAEEQLDGWKTIIQDNVSIYNDSPLGQRKHVNWHDFFILLCGMNSDHAEDQKKLFCLMEGLKETLEQEKRGEKVIMGLPVAQQFLLLSEIERQAVAEMGVERWHLLSESEQQEIMCREFDKVSRKMG